MLQVPDILSTLDDTERRIIAFVALDDAVHHRSYAPGKWTALAILAHISDTDSAFYYRFLAIASEAGARLVPFDETVWARELHVEQRPAAVSAAVIRGVHAGLAHQLRTLPKASLDRSSLHPEHGELSAHRIASVVAQHTRHHLNQLEAIRDGRGWTKADALDYWH
jgi:hypothetical protein